MDFRFYPIEHLYRGYTVNEGEGVMVEFSYVKDKAILLLLIAPCTITVDHPNSGVSITETTVAPNNGYWLPLVYMPQFKPTEFQRIVKLWKDIATLAAQLWLTDPAKSREIIRNFVFATEGA